MHIGLVGGIGPAATDFYYRRLIAAFARRGMPLELTIVHADTSTLLRNLTSDDRAGQVAIYARLAARLAAAGAECGVITSIAGHFCIAEFEAVSPLPVIDMLSAINRAIEARGLTRVGILGTRTVMASRLFGRVSAAEVVPPTGGELDAVHDAYVTMATAGVATESQRAVFDGAVRRLMDAEHAEAIVLGGTDLALVYRDGETSFPIVDGAAIHVDAIVAQACR